MRQPRSCFGSPCEAFVAVTGQTAVYERGDDGDIQAGVRFATARVREAGNGTVTDTLTGLIWLQDASCFGPRTWSETLTAIHAL